MSSLRLIQSLRVGRRAATLALCATLPAGAFAELSNESLLGFGVRTRAAYDGSASQVEELVPVVRAFGQPWFARSTQGALEGGVRFELAPGLHAGTQLSYESGRQTSSSDFLERHGVSPIQRGASIGLHLEWDHSFGAMPVTLLGRVRKHTNADLGTQADLRLSVGVLRSGPVAAGVFTQATWADTKSSGAFYGITPQQSAITGLPIFSAASGWLSLGFGLLWSVDLSRNWIALGALEARRLQGDAAGSPLVERVWSPSASAALAYRY